jgi:hypothetical protein
MATIGVAAAAVAPAIGFSASPVAHVVKRSVATIERTTPKPVKKTKIANPVKAAPAAQPAKTVDTVVTKAHLATQVSVAQHVVASAPVQTAPRVTAPVVLAANTADGDYIEAMQAAFGRHLTVEQLISLKSMGITPADVTRWHQAGFPAIRVNEVIEAQSVGLTPATLAGLRSTFGTLSFGQAIAMQSMHLDAQYASEMKGAGLQNISPEQLLSLKSLGVTRDYVMHANALGFGTLSVGQIVELKSLGIDSDYIQRVRSHGFTNLRFNQLIELKTSGVIQ